MTQYTNIMQYESDIWAAADLLIAAGIKQSKFPDYMMPYFAVMLLESRMLQVLKDIEEEGYSRADDLAEYIEAFKEQGMSYNEYIVNHGKTLSDICKNDTTFKQDWNKYLKGFDSELKMLLGVERGSEESKYLNISGVSAELEKKEFCLPRLPSGAKWILPRSITRRLPRLKNTSSASGQIFRQKLPESNIRPATSSA